jgi:hypothetical protein
MRRRIIVAIALVVGALHFAVGPGYRGPLPRFVHGYLIDIVLPFAMFLVMGLIDRPLVGTRWFRAVAVFGVGAATETLQGFGVPIFGRTFDPLDYLMFAIGVLGAVVFEATVLERFPLQEPG